MTPSLWVCERTGDWAAALRAVEERTGKDRPPIVELRSSGELRQRTTDARRDGESPALIVVEVTPGNAEVICDTVAWLERQTPETAVVAAVHREYAHCEKAAREAGAALFLVSRRDTSLVWNLYDRVATLHEGLFANPLDNRPVTEQIWATLPWTR